MSHDEHGHEHHDNSAAAQQGCFYLLGFLIAVAAACVAPILLLTELGVGVAVPVITVFGEPIQKDVFTLPLLGDITNTFVALILVDIVVFFVAYNLRDLKEIPTGFQNGFEALFEFLYNQTKSIVGPRAKEVFPVVATLFLVVLTANWMKIIPGYESVGALHCAADDELVTMSGYSVTSPFGDTPTIFEDGGLEALEIPFIVFLNVTEPLDTGTSATEEGYEACEYKYLGYDEYAEYFYGSDGVIDLNAEAEESEGDEAVAAAPSEGEPGEGEGEEEHHIGPIGVTEEVLLAYEAADQDAGEVDNIVDNLVVAPFLRGASTDLNFTLALAVFAMFFVQFFGVQTLGLGYFTKFLNLPAVGNVGKNPMGVMDFVVGILEILSEFSKIISFAFRLFGVMFAGGILLIVALFLAGSVVPVAVLGLEIFVGLIQAYVFFILPLVLINIAMQSHH